MRLEHARPLTWMLATLAGWALLAWVLALAGMGGRTAPMADDPSLAQPLPVLTAAPPERLHGPGDHAEAVRRPLFFAERRPLPFFLPVEGGTQAEASPFEFVLSGVLIAPGLRMATLQRADGGEGPRVREGDPVEGFPAWRLLRLSPRAAVFAGPEGERELELRVFAGVGGPPMPPPPPTPAPAPDQPTPVPAPAPVPPASAEAVRAAAAAALAAQAAAGASSGAPPADAGNTPEQQARIDEIRRRIEARREELRRQSPPEPTP